jgi:hypothetical protein
LCFRNLTRADNPSRTVDDCKAEFNEERAAHHRACTSCRGGVGLNSSRGREIPKTYGGQIRAKLAGTELTDNVHWRDRYQRNGTVMSTSMGRKRTGKWQIENDQLCIEFEKEPIPQCYDVWLSGNQVELRREGLSPLEGTLEPLSGRN